MIFILGSTRGSRADFGGFAEIFGVPRYTHMEQKVREGEDAIARRRAACAAQNEQSLQVLSLRSVSSQMMLPVAVNGN